jgi:hypothetical protein
VEALLFQLLEHELGGVRVYEAALRCARLPALREQWQKFLDQTLDHVDIARGLVDALGLDPDLEHPARPSVRATIDALVARMQAALAGDPVLAQVVAAESVMQAEAVDQLNWEVMGEIAQRIQGDLGVTLRQAHQLVAAQEADQLDQTVAWVRALWSEAIGLPLHTTVTPGGFAPTQGR